ncbi:uncharacterized protein LOC126705221 [Quercus robur]|uniref:uncharacterized protein LOC126705221 n=1 Tax=Quercus robur TaxID=38942 RepID=UPI002162CA9C|nr:uncharacterized protein LOC126705221 [Quercus robur]
MEVQIHDHSLTLLRKLITFTCDACGKEGKDTPYLCLTCAFCVHPICASLHRTVKHVRHQHTLNLTYSLHQIQFDHQICLLCVEKVDTKYGFYYCSSCTFVAHLSCAADGEIEDNVNVLKDEDKESIEPTTTESVGLIILHFKCTTLPSSAKYEQHEHSFTLQYTPENDSGENYCDICEEERHSKHWYYY